MSDQTFPARNGGSHTREKADPEPSVSDLVRTLSEQASRLARQEMELAKVELKQKGKAAGVGAGAFGGAGVTALYGVGALTAAAIMGLATVVAGWLAAIIVAVVWFAVAGTLALVGRTGLKRMGTPVPEETIETVKEDVEWAKTKAAEGRR